MVKFHGSHFENSYRGHYEYIGECLHILKCLLGDSLHVYQFWCFYQKVHNRLDMLDYAAAL